MESAIKSRDKVPTNVEKLNLDYGDVFESFFKGAKSRHFFLANSYFCLKESSWTDNVYSKFFNNYIDSISKIDVLIKKNKILFPFITYILEYFNFKSERYYNNLSKRKDASRGNINKNNDNLYYNECVYKEEYSHSNMK